jgi:hypothetical protein
VRQCTRRETYSRTEETDSPQSGQGAVVNEATGRGIFVGYPQYISTGGKAWLTWPLPNSPTLFNEPLPSRSWGSAATTTVGNLRGQAQETPKRTPPGKDLQYCHRGP